MKILLTLVLFSVVVAHASEPNSISTDQVNRIRSEMENIPVEVIYRPSGIFTDEDKLHLLLLAQKEYPNRSVKKIVLHTWGHPNDRSVASVEFTPKKGEGHTYIFGRTTVFNRNWRHRWDKEEQVEVYAPKDRWYLTERSRRDIVRHEFVYNGENILANIGTHRYEDIDAILRMFEKGVIHRQYKVIDKVLTNEVENEWVTQWNFQELPVIRIETKKDVTHVIVSYPSYRLHGRRFRFIIEDGRIISDGIINWMANNASQPIAASRGEG